jgi:S-DNA-T family DNA segregation ATPase FtsK/SpoIIIE
MSARTFVYSRRRSDLREALKRFLRRRLREARGIALILVALLIAVALASFDPADPNFNVAAGREPANWLGRPGSYGADFMLQTLGWASYVLALVFFVWGFRIVAHRNFDRVWLNVLMLPPAVLALAAFLSALPVPEGWTLRARLGGWVGDLLHGQTLTLLPLIGLPPWPWLSGALLLPVFFAALAASSGLSLGEWRRLGHGLGFVGSWVVTALAPFVRTRPKTAPDAPEHDRAQVLGKREPTIGGTTVGGMGSQPMLGGEPIERRVETGRPTLHAGKRLRAEAQLLPGLKLGQFRLPPLSLLGRPKNWERGTGNKGERQNAPFDEEALEQNARLLESVLGEFGVIGSIIKVRPGPVVTLYELEPAAGTKSSRVIGLADDIARSMSALSARVAIIPGRNAIGIELPNLRRETVFLAELLATAEYENAAAKLPLALGKDIAGQPVIADLARMPHLLVAGTTGSGKSVAINIMILSLLYRLKPDECRMIMIDPKMLELSVYDGIPHLLAPVVTEPAKALVALKWTVREMEERYRKMSELGVRNVASYNQRLAEARARRERLMRSVQTGFDDVSGEPLFEQRELALEPLPLIVVIVDELADLMMIGAKDIEILMQRLAQMARAAGIHLIVATQRPSVDVITGTIKANFPTRISFQVTSKIDSRTILGEQGAEQLLGMGDMLFMPSAGRLTRVHGPFVSDDEVETVVGYLKSQGVPEFVEAVTAEEDEDNGLPPGFEADALYDQAVALVTRQRKASTSFIQRHLQIGYNRAARIIERMETEGVVGQANHVGKREVLARAPSGAED